MDRKSSLRDTLFHLAPVLGVMLVASGVILFIDQRLKTSWLSISIPAVVGAVLVVAGIVKRKQFWLVTGIILFGLGGGLFFGLQRIFTMNLNLRLCCVFAILGVSFLSIILAFWFKDKRIRWWLFFAPLIFIGFAIAFSFERPTLLEFILIQSVVVSAVFLLWGFATRKLGFIIPGALLFTIGAGVYVAWNDIEIIEGLQSTGIMLVWFSLGWILITVFNRFIHKRFTWWPLIPGGILLMVGAGLYIGGNPENALGFLGNTGSIALILFGIYLILLKFGMKNSNH